MQGQVLKAGAAQRRITPQGGAYLAGWSIRATGDTRSRWVRDELQVKALVVQSGDQTAALIVADLIGVDAMTAARIRSSIAARAPIDREAILICATHTHSGPVMCASAAAVPPAALPTVRADGSLEGTYGQGPGNVAATAYYVGQADLKWKEWFVAQAVEAALEAWRSRRRAEVAFGQAAVEGVASSRRVRLSDGTWADPRQGWPAGVTVVSCSEIDPLLRLMLVRETASGAPVAAVLNFGTHPWIFSTAGISAELAGAAAQAVARVWRSEPAEPPVVLYTTGPEGDVTTIWQVDLENVWKTWPGESPQDSLARREGNFDGELQRLSRRMAEGAAAAIHGIELWEAAPRLETYRRLLPLPLKPGYQRPAEIQVAEWQTAAPEGHHLTELHVLQLGEGAILALPGEPFASLGKRIRARSPFRHLLIAALANDYGPISYLAEKADFALGGYELISTPAAPEAGEVLVDQALASLDVVMNESHGGAGA